MGEKHILLNKLALVLKKKYVPKLPWCYLLNVLTDVYSLDFEIHNTMMKWCLSFDVDILMMTVQLMMMDSAQTGDLFLNVTGLGNIWAIFHF